MTEFTVSGKATGTVNAADVVGLTEFVQGVIDAQKPAPTPTPPTPAPTPPADSGGPTPGKLIYVVDYAPGDFSQWDLVQNCKFNDYARNYKTQQYPATVVTDPVKGKVGRFEIRPTDVGPGSTTNQRTDVGAPLSSGGTEGQIRWYEWSTKFDTNFPDGAKSWSTTGGHHPNASSGSSVFEWDIDPDKPGYWQLGYIPQSGPPGKYDNGTITMWRTPFNRGTWHNIAMQIKWSTTDGWGRLWYNGVRQKFLNGTDTWPAKTLIPGTTNTYFKQGLYRSLDTTTTAVIFHSGVRVSEG